MNVTVREFLESDREALRELFVAARNQAFSWALSSEFKPEDFDSFTKDERVLVAVLGNRQIGFASIWEADSFLHNLFIHPEYQRRGVGKTLLGCCEKYFSGTATLKCVKANDSARQFYESQGWSVHSEAEGPEGPYLLMERVRPNKVTNYAPSAQDAPNPRLL
jgi:GNAT superfamily N-acetyltransferase